MPNLNMFLGSKISTIFIVVITVLVLLLCVFVVIMLWWTEVKQKTKKQFFKAILKGFSNFGNKISPNKPVKTVYSDKSRNYSGTEFLPIPAKAPTKEYTYEFAGWDKNYTDKNGNTIARPVFIQKVNTCVVNVYDDDETTLLKTATVEWGAGLDVSDISPKKPDSKEFVYEFVGFNKDTKNIYGSQNITAVYKAIPKKFTYTFYDRDGKSIVSQTTAIYGTPILVPEPPKSEEFGEQFAYWRGLEEGMILTKDEQFVAVFKKGVNPDVVVAEGTPRRKLSSVDTLKIDIQDMKKAASKSEQIKTGAEIISKADEEKENSAAGIQDEVEDPNLSSVEGNLNVAELPESEGDISNHVHPSTESLVREYNSDIPTRPDVSPAREVQKLEVGSEEQNAERLANSITYIGQKKRK